MTKKEAYAIGLEVAEEINANGDFTPKELASEDAFAQAFYEIAENRQQYAGDVTEDFRRDSEWEGYEEGLAAGLAKIVRRRKFASNPPFTKAHFDLIAEVLRVNRPVNGTPEERELWNSILDDFRAELNRVGRNFDDSRFFEWAHRHRA
jgi:hypothetical protein